MELQSNRDQSKSAAETSIIIAPSSSHFLMDCDLLKVKANDSKCAGHAACPGDIGRNSYRSCHLIVATLRSFSRACDR